MAIIITSECADSISIYGARRCTQVINFLSGNTWYMSCCVSVHDVARYPTLVRQGTSLEAGSIDSCLLNHCFLIKYGITMLSAVTRSFVLYGGRGLVCAWPIVLEMYTRNGVAKRSIWRKIATVKALLPTTKKPAYLPVPILPNFVSEPNTEIPKFKYSIYIRKRFEKRLVCWYL